MSRDAYNFRVSRPIYDITKHVKNRQGKFSKARI